VRFLAIFDGLFFAWQWWEIALFKGKNRFAVGGVRVRVRHIGNLRLALFLAIFDGLFFAWQWWEIALFKGKNRFAVGGVTNSFHAMQSQRLEHLSTHSLDRASIPHVVRDPSIVSRTNTCRSGFTCHSHFLTRIWNMHITSRYLYTGRVGPHKDA